MTRHPRNTVWEDHGSEWRAVFFLLTSALAFSTAGFFAREAPVAVWAMIFWRNLFGGVALAALLALRSGSLWHLGIRGWVVTACSAFGTVCYIAAFAHTSVANISIIYATAPMFTAALAWVGLRERPSHRTLAAASIALIGVTVTVGGSLSAGTASGDGLALLMTAALSCVAVLARGTDLPAVQTALTSALLAALVAVPLAWLAGSSPTIETSDALWLAVFGFVTMTIALPCYLAGARHVPAGKAMLISSLELPFAPLWVWLAFGEMPSRASLVGGLIIVASIGFDVKGSRHRSA